MLAEERKIFDAMREDLTQGTAGIQKGYYKLSSAQQPDTPNVHKNLGDVVTSIIEILELIGSDFSKNGAELFLSWRGRSGVIPQKLAGEDKLSEASKEQDWPPS